MKGKYSREQWMVLIGGCLFQCAMLGVLINCTGVLFAQMRLEYGFSMTRISVYNTLKSVTTALAAAGITAFYFRSNKRLFLLLNQLALILSFLLLVVKADSPLWYVSAVVSGVASCISTAAVPMLLSAWFPGGSGTVTGIAMAFSGVGGAVCNPLCAKLISLFGWKWAVLLLGLVMVALTLPGLYLMFRNPAPETQYRKVGKQTGETAERHISAATIVLVCLSLLGGSAGVLLAVNISMFAQSIGYSLAVGASLTTMIMIGNVGGKFLYGLLCDRLGAWRATLLTLGAAIASVLCFTFAQSQLAVLYAAALMLGSVYALSVVAVSACCLRAYGEQESKRYLGVHTSINSVVMAGSSLLLGALVDWFGSFTPVLVMVLCAMACALAATLILLLREKKAR